MMDWQALMARLMAGLEPLVLALLSAAIVYVIGWLKAHTEAVHLNTNQTKTALAVAATNQTMPDASGDKKLGATIETLGAGADRSSSKRLSGRPRPRARPAAMPRDRTSPLLAGDTHRDRGRDRHRYRDTREVMPREHPRRAAQSYRRRGEGRRLPSRPNATGRRRAEGAGRYTDGRVGGAAG